MSSRAGTMKVSFEDKPKTIEEQTQAYWVISSVWNGRIDAKITAQRTLVCLRHVTKFHVHPQSKVNQRASKLLQEIIMQTTPEQTPKQQPNT